MQGIRAELPHRRDPSGSRWAVDAFGLQWTDQDAKDLIRGLMVAVLSAFLIGYVLRRQLGAKV